MTKRASFLKRIAPLILLIALVVCSGSGYRWMSRSGVQNHFARAAQFVQQRKGPEAEAEWLAIVRADPKNGAALELLGEYYMSRHNWDKGAEAFNKLSGSVPPIPHTKCRFAACLLRLDDQGRAFAAAEEELKVDPNCVTALGLTTALMAQQPGSEKKKQIEYLRRLAALQPDDLSIQQLYAQTLSNQFYYQEMRTVCARILQLDPKDAGTYNLLGFADLARADRQQGAKDAIQNFTRSLQLSPDNNGGAHFGLGRAYLLAGEAPRAVTELETAQRSLPMLTRLYTELGHAYRQANQPAKARSATAQALTLQHIESEQRQLTVRCAAFPKDFHYPRRLADLCVQTGEYNRAVYYYQKASLLHPNDPELAHNIETLNGLLAQTANHIPQ